MLLLRVGAQIVKSIPGNHADTENCGKDQNEPDTYPVPGRREGAKDSFMASNICVFPWTKSNRSFIDFVA